MSILMDNFIVALGIYSIASLILIRVCYYGFSNQRSHAAAFLLFGMGVFLVTSQLYSADISMGFAFGLFAVFSMLRYRTESINIKEMTYLFLTIAMALLCAVSQMSVLKLSLVCGLICLLAYILEINLIFPLHLEREIVYEKIENVNANNKQELYDDLTKRTGLNIKHVQIVSMDFMRDSAIIKIQYVPGNTNGPETNNGNKASNKSIDKMHQTSTITHNTSASITLHENASTVIE